MEVLAAFVFDEDEEVLLVLVAPFVVPAVDFTGAAVNVFAAPGVRLAVHCQTVSIRAHALPVGTSLYVAVSSTTVPAGSNRRALPVLLLKVSFVSRT